MDDEYIGQPWSLAKAGSVLEHLMRNAGTAVSKQDILDHVWDVDFAGDANIVEVYVGYLRRKLGRSAVRTVRNVGYQLTGAVG